VQVAPLSPVKPASHSQASNELLATGEFAFVGQAWQVLCKVAPNAVEYVPPPQSLHDSSPVTLYLPSTQAVQVPTLVMKKPALH